MKIPCLVGSPSLFIPFLYIFLSTFMSNFCVLPKQFCTLNPFCVIVVAQEVKFLWFHSCIKLFVVNSYSCWFSRIEEYQNLSFHSKGDLSSFSYHSSIPYQKQLLPFAVSTKSHDFTKPLTNVVLCFKSKPPHLEHKKKLFCPKKSMSAFIIKESHFHFPHQ